MRRGLVIVVLALLAVLPVVGAAPAAANDDSGGITVVAMIPSDTGQGYLVVGDDGRVVAYGDASHRGSAVDRDLAAPIVGAMGDDDGYALIGADGEVITFGAAEFEGSLSGRPLNQPIVGGAFAPGGGYWLFAADGGVFAFGGAPFLGSMGGRPLNRPIVGGAAAPGGGYWMVASDGGIFSFGGASFFGSMGGTVLNQPIVDMAAAADGTGYWLFAADGGVFAFGSAGFLGSGADIGTAFGAFTVIPSGAGYWGITPAGALQTFGAAGRFGSPITGPPRRDVSPTLELVGRFTQPVAAIADPDTGLMLVAERIGRVLEWNPDTDDRRVVLDISSTTTTSSERGLLGVALDAERDLMFLSSTDLSGDLVISEVDAPLDGGRTAGSRRVLFDIDQPFGNHNGGDIHVGPDGMLWISSGDGGSGGDPFDNAQDLTDLLGGILRIDPRPTGEAAYTIPADNPFASGAPVIDCDGRTVTPRPELWAHGLRNPWRISFDDTTGDLWIGDVGQSRREEINRIEGAVASGGGMNFGWNRREGTVSFAGGGTCAAAAAAPIVGPVFEYSHTGGRCSVSGGVVYRGEALPQLQGRYIFGDLCSGEIWALLPSDPGAGAPVAGLVAPGVVEFAADGDGELFVISIDRGIFRLAGV